MVAISLYRGNLHLRLPDRPRQWPMPHRGISLRDFKRLTHRRSKALSLLPLLPSSSSSLPIARPKEETDDDPQPPPPPPLQQHQSHDSRDFKSQPDAAAPNCLPLLPSSSSSLPIARPKEEVDDDPQPPPPPLQQHQSHHSQDFKSQPDAAAPNCPPPLPANAAGAMEEAVATGASKPAVQNGGNEPGDCSSRGNGGGLKDSQDAGVAGTVKAEMEVTNGSDALDVKEKRKKDLERKLQILNERKHQLVQALKQILNAEEEMMRRNSIQMAGVRSGVPSQAEAHAVPKMSAEGNLGDDLEGESEDASNHNPHARHLQTQCTSPSMASPLRRPGYGSLQHNVATYPSRGGLIPTGLTQSTSNVAGVTASPSRFAPPGHQGPAVGLAPVSVSGSHFIASSPSPAASGGTSGFRDGRLTSPPWNREAS